MRAKRHVQQPEATCRALPDAESVQAVEGCMCREHPLALLAGKGLTGGGRYGGPLPFNHGDAMPMKPPRIAPCCGRSVPAGQRCACQQARDKARKAEADKNRPSARQRGYDREYQVAAAVFLRRHPVCTCGAAATVVRHRISIAKRPDLRMDQSNWLPGCKSCNAKDYHRERRQEGGGSKLSGNAVGPTGGPSREIFSNPAAKFEVEI